MSATFFYPFLQLVIWPIGSNLFSSLFWSVLSQDAALTCLVHGYLHVKTKQIKKRSFHKFQNLRSNREVWACAPTLSSCAVSFSWDSYPPKRIFVQRCGIQVPSPWEPIFCKIMENLIHFFIFSLEKVVAINMKFIVAQTFSSFHTFSVEKLVLKHACIHAV